MRSKGEGSPLGDVLRQLTLPTQWSPQESRRAFLRFGTGMLAWATFGGPTCQGAGDAPNRPSTSRASQEQAMRDMPIKSLPEPLHGKIQQIVGKPTIYRRLPVEVIPCDPDLYVFLVRYPEVIVNMWQLMGVTKVVIKRTGAYTYDAEDGAGTVSQVELVYGTKDKHLFMAEGYYEGPLLPRKVTGRCVLLLNSAFSHDAAQRAIVSTRLDVFVQLDNVGAEIVARTLHPLMGRTVDRNFAESSRFVGQLSHVTQSNGEGVQRMISRLNSIDPEVRTQFAQLTASINQRAVLRSIQASQDQQPSRLSDARGDTSSPTTSAK